MREITAIVVHHSASPRTTTLEEIREWHLRKRYNDIGYHFVIEAGGVVRVGRDVSRQGAHVKGQNKSTIGICVTGDNTHDRMRWSPEQKSALRALIAGLRAGFPGVRVVGHRDIAATLCPGVNIDEVLA